MDDVSPRQTPQKTDAEGVASHSMEQRSPGMYLNLKGANPPRFALSPGRDQDRGHNPCESSPKLLRVPLTAADAAVVAEGNWVDKRHSARLP